MLSRSKSYTSGACHVGIEMMKGVKGVVSEFSPVRGTQLVGTDRRW